MAASIALCATLALVPRSALAHVAAPCSSAPIAGTQALSLSIDGTSRSALLHVPAGLPAGRTLPLILALHGYGGSGSEMARYSGLSAVADRYGFLVAYPSSDGLYWNSNAVPTLPNDVHFLARLITVLQARECIDGSRVFITGVSNGGGMTALAGCELSDEVAAIAPVAGGYDGQPPCHPRRPISVLEVHGSADQVVPYFGRRARRTADGLPPFVNAWVGRDRCAARPRVARIAARTTRYRWGGCAGGVAVEHIRITGGRHQWPGAMPPDPGPPSTICGACAIWSFFAGLRPTSRRWPSSGGAHA